MKRASKKKVDALHQQASLIATEIFDLVNQYTHDSATSKFFLSDEINKSFYITAGGFASVIYSPQLEADEIKDTYALLFFLVLITYGFQIYVKERSLRTNAAPFRLTNNGQAIEHATNLFFQQAEEGELYTSPLAEAITEIILQQIEKNIALQDFALVEHSLDGKKLYEYMAISLYYGYNMATTLIKEETPT